MRKTTEQGAVGSVLTKKYPDDQMKKNVMGRICDTYRGRKVAYKVLVGGPEGKETIWKT